LALEAERMKAPTITQEALAAERAFVRAERPRRPESSPSGRGMRRLFGLLRPDLPYRRPVTGSGADLERLTPRDCDGYFASRFRPQGALLTIVGRFAPDAALRAAASTVERVPRHGVRFVRPVAKPVVASRLRARDLAAFELPLLFVGWRAPAAASVDAP